MNMAIGNSWSNGKESVTIQNITVEVQGDMKVKTQIRISRTDSKGDIFVDVVDHATLFQWITKRKLEQTEQNHA